MLHVLHEEEIPVNNFSFIHAADIHLDTPFHSITAKVPKEYVDLVRTAPKRALQNIADLAVQHNVDFVILAGDVYNGMERTVTSQLALRNFAITLSKHCIRLYIVHGNHDPASSSLHSIRFPDNTFIFPTEYTSVQFIKNDTPTATLHGISHAQQADTTNLAQLFQATTGNTVHIGILHCSVDSISAETKQGYYAPCSLQDLLKTKMHYWALGHIHTRKILAETPYVVYSGNTQAIRSSEEGERGVYLVRSSKHAHMKLDFFNTAPVIFHTIPVDISEKDDLADILLCVEESIVHFLSTRTPANVELFLVTIRLCGTTVLHKKLYEEKDALLDAVQERSTYRVPVVVQDIHLETTLPIDMELIAAQDDILGEIIKRIQQIQDDPAEKASFLASLSPQISRNAASYTLPDPTLFEDILRNAQNIAIQKLYKE